MYFVNTHMGNFVLLAFSLSTSVSATPIASPPIDASNLQTRANNPIPHALGVWSGTGFQPASSYYAGVEKKGEENKGECWSMPPNEARSAKAPAGYKCTIYSEVGCHGWRTSEFNENGIADLGAKMNANGDAFRCCKIGTTNSWGYCDAKLNPGTY